MFSHLQECKTPSPIMVTQEDKHHSKCTPFSSFLPHFIYWAWCHVVWNIPFVSQSQLFQQHLLPTSCKYIHLRWCRLIHGLQGSVCLTMAFTTGCRGVSVLTSPLPSHSLNFLSCWVVSLMYSNFFLSCLLLCSSFYPLPKSFILEELLWHPTLKGEGNIQVFLDAYG